MEIPAAKDPVADVRDAFGESVSHVKEFRGETTIVVEPERGDGGAGLPAR